MRAHLFMLSLLAGVGAATGWAQALDPPLWTVVGNGTANQFTGQNFLITSPSNEVNQLGTTSELGLYVQGGSPNATGFSPLYLIMGFVNQNTSFSLPTITSYTVYNSVVSQTNGTIDAGTPTTPTTNVTGNALTSLDSIPPSSTATLPAIWKPTNTTEDVYTFVGLPAGSGGGDSEQFGNWQTAENALSINASQFLIAVYDLSSYITSSFTGQGLIDLTFNNTLPTGTMAVGFACQGPCYDTSNNPNHPYQINNNNLYENPFTQAGITTGGGNGNEQGDVPEPVSIVLLGTACLAVTFIERRRRDSAHRS